MSDGDVVGVLVAPGSVGKLVGLEEGTGDGNGVGLQLILSIGLRH